MLKLCPGSQRRPPARRPFVPYIAAPARLRIGRFRRRRRRAVPPDGDREICRIGGFRGRGTLRGRRCRHRRRQPPGRADQAAGAQRPRGRAPTPRSAGSAGCSTSKPRASPTRSSSPPPTASAPSSRSRSTTRRHDTIGIDLVAMCVNDLVVQGAEPLFFLDYFATGKLDAEVGAAVVDGIAEACQEARLRADRRRDGGDAGHLPAGDYDLAGFAVGAVERGQLLPRRRHRAGRRRPRACFVAACIRTAFRWSAASSPLPGSAGTTRRRSSRRDSSARRCSRRRGSTCDRASLRSARRERSRRSPTSPAAGLSTTFRACSRQGLAVALISTACPCHRCSAGSPPPAGQRAGRCCAPSTAASA